MEKIEVIGYVAGIIWPADGFEWLFAKNDLCSLELMRKAKPHEKVVIYKTKDEAQQRLEKSTYYNTPENREKYKPFVREYCHHSFIKE